MKLECDTDRESDKHTHRERERELQRERRERQRERESVRATEQQQVKQLLSMLRAFPTRLKTRAYRFYFVVCFFMFNFSLKYTLNFDFVFRHVCQVQLLFVFCHFSYAHWPTAFLNWGTNKIFAFFKAQNSPKNSCERCQSDLKNSILPRRISNALHSLPPTNRQDCFGSPFFNACVEALQLHEEMDKYNEWRDTLGRK